MTDSLHNSFVEVRNIRPIQVISVTSGKGGVGKTNISINLGLSLAMQHKKVLLFDADLGLANIDIQLGLTPKYNLSHVIAGTHSLDDIIIDGPLGIKIIPAASGVQLMANLSMAQHAGLISAFDQLVEDIDVLIIDTAAGISNTVTSFTRSSQQIIVVVCDEPASITDAYAFIKIMNTHYRVNNYHVLANMVQNATEGSHLFNKLLQMTDAHLNVCLDYMGAIPFDDYLRKSVKRQQSVCDIYPDSKSAIGFKKIAEKILHWPIARELTGNSCFFIERLMAQQEIRS